MDQLIVVLGTLGVYFAIVLVLAVSVESLLDLVKLRGWLRSRISPEQAMKSVAQWIPADAAGEGSIINKAVAQRIAIANFVTEFQGKEKEITEQIEKVTNMADQTLKAMGLKESLGDAEKQLVAALDAVNKKYLATEQRRIGLLRVISAVIGIVIALALQINTFDYLSPLIPSAAQEYLASPLARLGGMALTGLAASAGSSFWHDRLDQVRALKEAARQ